MSRASRARRRVWWSEMGRRDRYQERVLRALLLIAAVGVPVAIWRAVS